MAEPIRGQSPHASSARGDWFVLEVMRKESRRRDWVALLVDFDPDEYRSGVTPPYRQRWASIPGKHRNREAAVATLEDMLATRH